MRILILTLVLVCSFSQQVPINPSYFHYSFDFTNNGALDNSTCDMTIDGSYYAQQAGDSYTGFAWLFTSPMYAFTTTYAVGDRGFACNVDYVGGGTSWACRMVTAIDTKANAPGSLAFGAAITVSDVENDMEYISAILKFSLGQIPYIWNKTYALNQGEKLWVTFASVGSTSATLTDADIDTFDTTFNPQIQKFTAPECAQGFYNVQQSESSSLTFKAFGLLLSAFY